jgi:CheY-like chemotaxis protein
MNILIVDDDRDDREIFCEVLKELIPTVNCIAHENGDEALKFLRESQTAFDYIFLDVFLAGMNGTECLLKLKSIRSVQEVPVIMYSGMNDPNQVDACKALGAANFICKPSSMEELRHILASLLE